jgi:hypothetical protein
MTYPARTKVPDRPVNQPPCLDNGVMDAYRDLWKARTTKAPALQTPEPAAIATGAVVVKADRGRSEALIGSEDGCVLLQFQGGNSRAASALDSGSTN